MGIRGTLPVIEFAPPFRASARPVFDWTPGHGARGSPPGRRFSSVSSTTAEPAVRLASSPLPLAAA